MVYPNSMIRKFWDTLVALAAFFAGIEIPLRIFVPDLVVWPVMWFEAFYTIVFAADLGLNFRTAIFHDGYLIEDPATIARTYIRTWFWIDLVSAFPSEWIRILLIKPTILSLEETNHTLLWTVLQTTTMLKLARLFKILMGQQNLYRKRILNPSLRRLFLLLFFMALFAHWMACIWIFLGRWDENITPAENYVRSLYWSITTLTTIGYGDIVPKTMPETIFTMFVQVTGAGFYGFIVGNLASILANFDNAKSAFRWKVEIFENFMKKNHFPPDLQMKVRSYFQYLWDTKKGYEQLTILQDLPKTLQSEISIFLYRDLLKKVPIFEELDTRDLHRLTLALKLEIFLPGDVIFYKGEIGSKMYFVSRGKIAITDESEKDVYAILRDGAFFGEIALVRKVPRTANARSLDFAELYSLEKEDMLRILSENKKFMTKLKEIARQRLRENKEHISESS